MTVREDQSRWMLKLEADGLVRRKGEKDFELAMPDIGAGEKRFGMELMGTLVQLSKRHCIEVSQLYHAMLFQAGAPKPGTDTEADVKGYWNEFSASEKQMVDACRAHGGRFEKGRS